MKKLYQIFELLTDILHYVKCINRHLTIEHLTSHSEQPIAMFYASSRKELEAVARDFSITPVPPVALNEIYVIKVYKKSIHP